MTGPTLLRLEAGPSTPRLLFRKTQSQACMSWKVILPLEMRPCRTAYTSVLSHHDESALIHDASSSLKQSHGTKAGVLAARDDDVIM